MVTGGNWFLVEAKTVNQGLEFLNLVLEENPWMPKVGVLFRRNCLRVGGVVSWPWVVVLITCTLITVSRGPHVGL